LSESTTPVSDSTSAVSAPTAGGKEEKRPGLSESTDSTLTASAAPPPAPTALVETEEKRPGLAPADVPVPAGKKRARSETTSTDVVPKKGGGAKKKKKRVKAYWIVNEEYEGDPFDSGVPDLESGPPTAAENTQVEAWLESLVDLCAAVAEGQQYPSWSLDLSPEHHNGLRRLFLRTLRGEINKSRLLHEICQRDYATRQFDFKWPWRNRFRKEHWKTDDKQSFLCPDDKGEMVPLVPRRPKGAKVAHTQVDPCRFNVTSHKLEWLDISGFQQTPEELAGPVDPCVKHLKRDPVPVLDLVENTFVKSDRPLVHRLRRSKITHVLVHRVSD
jgi:hypothetical protein